MYRYYTLPVLESVAPEGAKRATSVNVQLLRLQKDLRTGSISRDIIGSVVFVRASGILREALQTSGSLLAFEESAVLVLSTYTRSMSGFITFRNSVLVRRRFTLFSYLRQHPLAVE